MVASKVITIAKEIDSARCKGNWQALPELMRRYKKYDTSGIALEQTVSAEIQLNQLLQTHRKESRKIFANDSLDHITLSTRIAPHLLKPVQQQLATALGDKDSSSETQQLKQMTKIILARTYFESGEYEKTLETIEDANYQRLQSIPGYSFSLYVQALSIRAMALDLLENKEASLEVYSQLVKTINQCDNLIDPAVVDWAEEGLYRGTLIALKEQPNKVLKVMGLIRAYQKTTSSQTNAWRVYKRLVVTIQSLDYLSTIYREGNYQPPVGFAETEEGKHINEIEFEDAKRAYNHQLFSIEVIQLYTIYEKLVYTLTQFPRSGESSSLVLDFVNRFAKDFALIGGSETEKRGYLEALNRAHLKTFNSPCITRHVFHGLVSLGDYQEAEHALHTYLYLVGLESKALFDAKSDTPALASDSFGYSTPVPHADGQSEVEHLEQALKSDGPEKSSEEESAIDQVGVITASVKMYCQELSKGAEAVRIAELSVMIYKRAYNEEVAESLNVLGVEAYHTLGIALGFLASQTFDPETRPKFYARALDALRKALEFDNRNWEIYYQMALQLAEMHDIMQAIQMVTQSIQLNQQHLPSWHLLALLCTCPVKNNKAQALRTCDIGLSQASSILEDTWVDYSDEVEQQVKLYMLHALLTEQVHGIEAALGLQESLFQMFGKIVVPELIPNSNDMLHEAISNGNTRYGMVLSGSLGNMSNEPTVSSGQKVSRGRSASSASRSSSVIVKGGRARSVSSFTGRKLHLAELFSEKTDTNSTHSVPHTSSGKHGSRLNMLDPKHLIRKQKREMSDDSVVESALVMANGSGSASSVYSVSQSVLSTNTLLQNTNTLNRPTIQARLQHQRSCHMLCDMWLLSAEIFLRSGKIEESLKAVSEAENVDWTTHAGVWCMLGRIRLAQKLPEEAIKAFQKGLVAKPNDVNCRVWLAKTYVERGDLEVAEGLLEAVTKENGWDCAVAWFYLGEIYKKTDRVDKTKDCLFYALELESTTPIQPFSSLPRCIQ